MQTLKDVYLENTSLLDRDYETVYAPNEKLLEKVSLFLGDITNLEINAIVNAANRSLMGGSGVNGAIHRVAGPSLLQECLALNGCATGDAKITAGYKLPATYVIHAVGPIYSSERKEEAAEELASAYRRSLQVAVEHGARTVAFPCISTGIYGYPTRAAAHVALDEVRRFLEGKDGDKLDMVWFCIFLEHDMRVYEELMVEYFPVPLSFNMHGDDGKKKDEVATDDNNTRDREQTGDGPRYLR